MTMDVNTLMSMNEGCDKPVGSGYITYPCRLEPRHEHTEGSPCVAPEVAASIRRYNDWDRKITAQRKEERARQEAFDNLTEEQKEAVNDRLARETGWSVIDAGGGGSVDLGGGRSTTVERHPDGAMDMAHADPEPTKQRPGDQRLPSGGGECVQDRIIADMEESMRVGIERYGQVLRTWNGRKGFQDVFEEVRDLHVYMTMVAMEAEASYEDLVEVVHKVMTESDGVRTRRETAEVIVEMLGGWVLANRLGGAPSERHDLG